MAKGFIVPFGSAANLVSALDPLSQTRGTLCIGSADGIPLEPVRKEPL